MNLTVPGASPLTFPDVSFLGAAIIVILVVVAAYIVLSQLAGNRRP